MLHSLAGGGHTQWPPAGGSQIFLALPSFSEDKNQYNSYSCEVDSSNNQPIVKPEIIKLHHCVIMSSETFCNKEGKYLKGVLDPVWTMDIFENLTEPMSLLPEKSINTDEEKETQTTLYKTYSHLQEVASLCCCSIQNWEDVHYKSKFLVGQEGVKADKYHTWGNKNLQPLVQGDTKGHKKEAGGHSPWQCRVPVPQDGRALDVAKDTYECLLKTLEVFFK